MNPKTPTLILTLITLLLTSCEVEVDLRSTKQYKKEILETERAFAAMAKEKGVTEAFLAFAAEDAVLKRDNDIIVGKEAIQYHFEQQPFTDFSLEWISDFVDVSSSGDLGYTYGHYTFSASDTSGQLIEGKGIYHTVWKRQDDGTWKYVWD